MASLPRKNLPPPMSTTASGSNNAVMPVTSPAFSLATNNRSKSWGSLAGSLVVKSFIVTLLQLLWVARGHRQLGAAALHLRWRHAQQGLGPAGKLEVLLLGGHHRGGWRLIQDPIQLQSI